MPENQIGEFLSKMMPGRNNEKITVEAEIHQPPLLEPAGPSNTPRSEDSYMLSETDIESLRLDETINNTLKDKLLNFFTLTKKQQKENDQMQQMKSQIDKLTETVTTLKNTPTVSAVTVPPKPKREIQLRIPAPKFNLDPPPPPSLDDVSLPGGSGGSGFNSPPPPNKRLSFADLIRYRYIDTAFPSTLFSGLNDKKSPTIKKFLEGMNQGQEVCNLTEEDFKKVLSRKCIGEPYDMVARWIDLKFSIEEIYQCLFKLYGKDPEPEAAQSLLITYRPPRGLTYEEAQQEIENLARSASLLCSTAAEQNSQYNNLAVMALRKSFPFNSSRYVEEEIARQTAERGRRPSYLELTSALKDYSTAINADLKNPPPDYKFGPARKFQEFIRASDRMTNTFRGNQHRHDYQRNARVHQIQADNGYEAHVNAFGPTPREPSNSGKQVYTPRTPNPNNPRVAGGKKYCPMCGSYNHSPSEQCAAMRDDGGKLIYSAISSGPCDICGPKVRMKLFHSERYCPLRSAMLKLYDSGDVTPKGVFADYYYARKKRETMQARPGDGPRGNYPSRNGGPNRNYRPGQNYGQPGNYNRQPHSSFNNNQQRSRGGAPNPSKPGPRTQTR